MLGLLRVFNELLKVKLLAQHHGSQTVCRGTLGCLRDLTGALWDRLGFLEKHSNIYPRWCQLLLNCLDLFIGQAIKLRRDCLVFFGLQMPWKTH